MKITRANMEALKAAVQDLLLVCEIESPIERWLDGQGEPKSSYVRDEIRDAREEVEDGVGPLLDTAREVIEILERKR